MGILQIAIASRGVEEPHCGDRAGYWTCREQTILCIADGLGHGRGAQQAAERALDFVGRHYQEPLLEIFAGCDRAIRNSRGVAMGMAVADPTGRALTYAGIGNIRALVAGRKTLRLISHYGIVGGGYRSLRAESVPLHPGDLVILSTDGIDELLDLSGYDAGLRADPGRLSRAILDRQSRGWDDAAVLVFRSGE